LKLESTFLSIRDEQEVGKVPLRVDDVVYLVVVVRLCSTFGEGYGLKLPMSCQNKPCARS
jgi:hypothetical protein